MKQNLKQNRRKYQKFRRVLFHYVTVKFYMFFSNRTDYTQVSLEILAYPTYLRNTYLSDIYLFRLFQLLLAKLFAYEDNLKIILYNFLFLEHLSSKHPETSHLLVRGRLTNNFKYKSLIVFSPFSKIFTQS